MHFGRNQPGFGRRKGAKVILSVDLLDLPEGGAVSPPRDLFETWQRSLPFLIHRNYPPLDALDIPIVPLLAEMSFTDFGEIPGLIRRGEAAVTAALPEIRKALEDWENRPVI